MGEKRATDFLRPAPQCGYSNAVCVLATADAMVGNLDDIFICSLTLSLFLFVH